MLSTVEIDYVIMYSQSYVLACVAGLKFYGVTLKAEQVEGQNHVFN